MLEGILKINAWNRCEKDMRRKEAARAFRLRGAWRSFPFTLRFFRLFSCNEILDSIASSPPRAEYSHVAGPELVISLNPNPPKARTHG